MKTMISLRKILQSINTKQLITLILCSTQLGLIFSGSISAETVYFRNKRVVANYRFHKVTPLTITLRRQDGKLITYNKTDIKRIEWDDANTAAKKKLEAEEKRLAAIAAAKLQKEKREREKLEKRKSDELKKLEAEEKRLAAIAAAKLQKEKREREKLEKRKSDELKKQETKEKRLAAIAAAKLQKEKREREKLEKRKREKLKKQETKEKRLAAIVVAKREKLEKREFQQAVLLETKSPELAHLSSSEKREYAEKRVEKEKREYKKAFAKAVRSPEFSHLPPNKRAKAAERKVKQERAKFKTAVAKEIGAPEFSNLALHERREYAEEKINEEKEAFQEAVEDAIESEELAHLSPRERQRQAEIKAKRKINQKRRKKEQEFKKLILLEEAQSPEAAHLPAKEKRKYIVKKAAWRRCWLASFFLPGAGQFCAYEYGKGWTYLSLSALSLTTALVAANQYSVELARNKDLRGRLLSGERISESAFNRTQVVGNLAGVVVVLSYTALAALYTTSIVDTFLNYPTVPEKKSGYLEKNSWENTYSSSLFPTQAAAKKDSPNFFFSFGPTGLPNGDIEMEGSLRIQSYF